MQKIAKNSTVELTDNEKQLLHIADELLDLSVMLERAKVVTDNLYLHYFGDRKEVHEESRGMWLLHEYDDARVLNGIANDYVYDALQLAKKIMENIDIRFRKGQRE